MPQLRSGDQRHRFVIQSYSEVQDAMGGVTRSWSTEATRWASVEQLTAQERLAHDQVEASEVVRITLKYYAGLTSDQRLTWNSGVYNIRSVNHAMGIHHKTVVIATRED